MSSDQPTHETPLTTPRSSGYDADLEREIADALGGMSIEEIERQSASTGSSGGKGRQSRRGTIIRIHSGDVFVEFGPRSQGVCPLSQFMTSP